MEERSTLVIRYIDGTLDGAQSERLEALMAADEDFRREVLEMKDIAHSLADLKLSSWEKERRFSDLMRGIGTPYSKKYFHHRLRNILGAAALFVLAFAIGLISGFLFRPSSSSRPVSFQVLPGNMSTVLLPDGSSITLKSASTLQYDASAFGQKERWLKLDGEAFFDVAKNKHIPFVVESSAQVTRVYGTRFNLQSYRNDEQNTLVLIDGSVEVELMDNAGKKLHALKMKPGERCVYDRTSGETTIVSVDKGELEQPWDGNVFFFREKSLAQIVSRLEYYYKARISLDPEIESLSDYSGAVSLGPDVESVLQSLNYDNYFAIVKVDKDRYLLNKNL